MATLNALPNLAEEDLDRLARQIPMLAVEAVIFDSYDRVLLVRRSLSPYSGYWGLPGGLLYYHETPFQAVRRIVINRCSLEVAAADLVDLVDLMGKDPRGHRVAAVYRAYAFAGEPVAKNGESVRYFNVNDPECQPFVPYHGQHIVKAARFPRALPPVA